MWLKIVSTYILAAVVMTPSQLDTFSNFNKNQTNGTIKLYVIDNKLLHIIFIFWVAWTIRCTSNNLKYTINGKEHLASFSNCKIIIYSLYASRNWCRQNLVVLNNRPFLLVIAMYILHKIKTYLVLVSYSL